MGSISSLNSLLSLQTDGTAQIIHVNHLHRNSTGALSLQQKYHNSSWAWDKTRNGTGDITLTTTPSIPTKTSYGAINHANASSGKELWLTRLSGQTSSAGMLLLYDRLYQVGGFSGTVTTAQTPASSLALTRYTSGVGNELFVEVHTVIGATPVNATCSYKNQDGTTKTSKTFTLGGTGFREVGRLIPIPLADGDTGVTEFLSITLATSTTTAGSFGVVICKKICALAAAMTAFDVSFVTGSVPFVKVETDAALFPVLLPLQSTATGGGIDLTYCFVEA